MQNGLSHFFSKAQFRYAFQRKWNVEVINLEAID